MTGDPDPNYGVPIMGQSTAVRFSAVALVVPVLLGSRPVDWTGSCWEGGGSHLRFALPRIVVCFALLIG